MSTAEDVSNWEYIFSKSRFLFLVFGLVLVISLNLLNCTMIKLAADPSVISLEHAKAGHFSQFLSTAVSLDLKYLIIASFAGNVSF